MAVKHVAYDEIHDDLVGMLLTEDNARTEVPIVFDGAEGTLDLSPAGYDALMALTRKDDAGNPAPDASGLALLFNPRRNEKTDAAQNREIRVWARSKGFQVGDSGRIPDDAMTAWKNAHQPTTESQVTDSDSGESETVQDDKPAKTRKTAA